MQTAQKNITIRTSILPYIIFSILGFSISIPVIDIGIIQNQQSLAYLIIALVWVPISILLIYSTSIIIHLSNSNFIYINGFLRSLIKVSEISDIDFKNNSRLTKYGQVFEWIIIIKSNTKQIKFSTKKFSPQDIERLFVALQSQLQDEELKTKISQFLSK